MNDGTFLPSLLAEQSGASKLAHHLGRTFCLPHVCLCLNRDLTQAPLQALRPGYFKAYQV